MSLAIARINGDEKATFKVLVIEGGRQYLRPLNPTHLPITDEFEVLGKVIGMWMAE